MINMDKIHVFLQHIITYFDILTCEIHHIHIARDC